MSGLLVAGRHVRFLERIAVAGEVCGLSRPTAYRMAEADDWPLVGPATSRFVSMPALLDKYAIPYTVESEAKVGAEVMEPTDGPERAPQTVRSDGR